MRTLKTALLTSVLAVALGASTAHAATIGSLNSVGAESVTGEPLVIVNLSTPDAHVSKSYFSDLFLPSPSPKPPTTKKAKSKK